MMPLSLIADSQFPESTVQIRNPAVVNVIFYFSIMSLGLEFSPEIIKDRSPPQVSAFNFEGSVFILLLQGK